MSRKPFRAIRRRLALILLLVAAAAVYPGYLHRRLWLAEGLYAVGRWEQARHYAAAHLHTAPDSRRARLLVARSARELSDFRTAEQAYRNLPTIPYGDLRWLASYYRATNQVDRQILTDRAILKQRPDDPDACLDLALVYQHRKDEKAAAEYAHRAVRSDPKLVAAWLCLAEVYQERFPKKSLECLTEAIALGPEDVWEWRKRLAHMLLRSFNRPDQAEHQLKLALREQPDDAEAHNLLADCYLLLYQPDAARGHLREALRLEPSDPATLARMANLELQQHGDWRAAKKYAEEALEHQPDNLQARNITKICQSLEQTGANSGGTTPKNLDAWRHVPVTWGFSDVASAWGVTFTHHSGENEQRRYLPEAFGSGCATFDFDGDGLLDIYFVNATDLAPDAAPPAVPHRNALFRNLGSGRFEPVSGAAGLGDTAFGHGVAVGDFDNDGHPDLYLSNYGQNKLFRNRGDGTFDDVTEASGTGDPGMSAVGAWFDYDEDGDLDLYVCNYAEYDVRQPVPCTHPGVGTIYCGPSVLQAQPDTLYRNNGDGTFSDVTEAMNIRRDEHQRKLGFGLGLVAAHFNHQWSDGKGDWHIDLFVANDTTDNFVFYGDGTKLIDATDTSGAAVNDEGNVEACMGVDAGDVDGDGDFDVVVTNFWRQKNTIYRNERGSFFDASYAQGLGFKTKLPTGWGTALIDFDNDGDLDNFVTNGGYNLWHTYPMQQQAMLFANRGDGVFEDVASLAGDYFERSVIGRGAAFADLDEDGDIDIVVNHWGDRCAVLRNDTQTAGSWIRLELVGVASNRDAVGTAARVRVGTRFLYYQRKGGTSYLSASDPRLLIGLGAADVVDSLELRWPSGRQQTFRNVAVNASYRVIEGRRPQRLTAP